MRAPRDAVGDPMRRREARSGDAPLAAYAGRLLRPIGQTMLEDLAGSVPCRFVDRHKKRAASGIDKHGQGACDFLVGNGKGGHDDHVGAALGDAAMRHRHGRITIGAFAGALDLEFA